jgi:AcrR family transcriptional regulator
MDNLPKSALHRVNLTQCKAYDKLYIMSTPQIPTRERILQETWHLMEQRRGQGVRIEDIAKAAEVSRQAVYLHFGSRAGLLIATVRYVDEALGLAERLRPVLKRQSGAEMLDAYVIFWANYIPDIYGLAKALLAVRETDEAAAAAWADRMNALYQGCADTVQCLVIEERLALEWTPEEAADFFWVALSIETWEHLTTERGWSQEQYIRRTQEVLKKALLRRT